MVLKTKNILVTGGTGFIGSHLVKRLTDNNYNVVVPYQSINPKSYFSQQRLPNKATLIHLDVKNFKRTLDIITKYEISIIFHLAAQPIVTTAFHNPLETFDTNIMGTANILEAARLYGQCESIIVCSSDKAYGKLPRVSEQDPLSGTHPYETSKSAADLIATTYFKTYKLPVVITRFGNVYGEGDLNLSRIIPGIMQSIALKKELLVRSDGKYIRDYIYVGDVIDALVQLSKNTSRIKGEAFNVSSKENLSVIGLIEKVQKALDTKISYKILNNTKNEIPVQSINYRKICQTVGWEPKNTLSGVAGNILLWYRNYFKDTGAAAANR